MAASPVINIAILGGGIFIQTAHVPAINELVSRNLVRVVAVYSRTEKSANDTKALLVPNEHISVYYGDDLQKIMEDQTINAVDICLPIDIQPDVINQALKSGKHVLSEKPVAPYSKVGKNLIAEYREKYSSLIWGIAENYYYEPYILEAKKYLDEGAIGDLRVCVVNFFTIIGTSSPYYHTKWRQEPQYLGGYVLDGGVHIVAGLRLLLGDIESVTGFQKQFNENLAPSDTIVCSFKTKSGALGSLAISYACNSLVSQFKGSAAPPMYRIYGTKGYISLSRDKLEVGVDDIKEITVHRNQNHTAIVKEFECFIEAIQSKSISKIYSPESALQDVEFIEAIFK